MNVGKTLFAQVMEFVPWKTFGRIIERHKGDAGATTIDLCLSLFEWAPFRSTNAAIKLHDVNVLDILPVEAGAF